MATQQPIQKDRSFLARYGATILRGGIAAIPAALYRYQSELGLPPQQVWFISAILSHKWESDLPHPSLHRMAAQTGVSRQQLHNYQRQLTESRWLEVINRHTAEGGKDTNFYDFSPLFAKLEELVDRDQKAGSNSGGGYDKEDLLPLVNPSLPTPVKAALPSQVNQGLPQVEASLGESVESEPETQKQFIFSNSKRSTLKENQPRKEVPETLPAAPPHRSARGLTRISALIQPPASIGEFSLSAPTVASVSQNQGERQPSHPTGEGRAATGKRRAQKTENAAVSTAVDQSADPGSTPPDFGLSERQSQSPSPAAAEGGAPDDLAELEYAVKELSRKLGDERHWRSNLTQVRNLAADSGLNHNAVTALLWTAFHETDELRKQGHLRKPGAYFFTRLRDAIDQRTNPAHRSLVETMRERLTSAPRRDLAGKYAAIIRRDG